MPLKNQTIINPIKQEFYAVAFRKKIYTSIEELQNDLDEWLYHYNNERTHQGKNCEGMTPMECFKKSKHLAQIKMIGYNSNESEVMAQQSSDTKHRRNYGLVNQTV